MPTREWIINRFQEAQLAHYALRLNKQILAMPQETPEQIGKRNAKLRLLQQILVSLGLRK